MKLTTRDFIAFIFKYTYYSNKNHHKPVIDKMHNNEQSHCHNCTASEVIKKVMRISYYKNRLPVCPGPDRDGEA